jgi:serine/threonine protein phosphatase PrpC
MRLRVGAGTDTGRVRALSETPMRTDEGLFVVCDGMGGAPAGSGDQMAVARSSSCATSGLAS